ncbi:hypothetical protein I41_37790 [Lacipirellula limnantheis]|uniref:Uncharacterized protein n=1 Tax=Lacipirellula limnantheis TaxID=2528024 RepID=A0A517U1U4_9BACT|nr:hypothetical protein I41_37790 [Lacipirellula limnantheis]
MRYINPTASRFIENVHFDPYSLTMCVKREYGSRHFQADNGVRQLLGQLSRSCN